MKYYWVKLSWMLITKVMHYLLINESSLLGKRWYRRVDDQCGDTNGDSNKCRLSQVRGKYIAGIKIINAGWGRKKK